ncbi:MAG TPA: lysyl endopeptidase [Candidatus Kapabacteria bacterium]|nr:lysyl endopeptidase [Candidatus Kapabacteria bacterium]
MSITAAVYCWEALYSGGQPVIDNLKASGFTTVLAWSVHVSATNADLTLNDTVIVTDGTYVGDPAWPGLLAQLKTGTTSVNRLLFSVGSGGGPTDFGNIQQLINRFGTGPTSPLYKNFAALLSVIPSIDGIDFDDEDSYNQDTVVQFAQMLAAIGYKQITFCPYTDMQFWAGCLQALQNSNPGLVTAYNLQCYAGGSINVYEIPQWIASIKPILGDAAASFILPGLWCRNGTGCTSGECPDQMEVQYKAWSLLGIGGGFIWRYDDILSCESSSTCSGNPMTPAAYANAILSGVMSEAV